MAHPKPLRAHTLPPTTPLSQKVGGHAGVHVTEDESLLLKPALPREVAFYQLVRDVAAADGNDDESSDAGAGLHLLRAWTPAFFGLLSLEGKLVEPSSAETTDAGAVPARTVAVVPAEGGRGGISATGDLDGAPFSSGRPGQTLVLQNLLHGYRKPCIMDVKLGTILYDEDASEEKKARMIAKAADTTSLTTGMRLTGFQVYSNRSPRPIVYGREYGYGLKPDQLQQGIDAFFPCASPTTANGDGDGGASSSSDSNFGLPVDTLFTVLESLHASLVQVREALSGVHARMVGSSVLLVYEGDWERAAAASSRGGGPGDPGEFEGEEEDADAGSDQIEVEVDERGEIVMDAILNEISDTSSEGSHADSQARLFTVSLIDFAHTQVVPGGGPDEGVLKGMDTLMRLVDHRKQEVSTILRGGSITS